ncbi:MAG: Asp23/Gls24 family envelope stress response protein [Pygmaiobacter sp.]
MDVKKSDTLGGSLQISTDVISKISKFAALEIEGIQEVSCGNSAMKGAFAKVNIQKPVAVELAEDVAEITIDIIVKYGYKIPSVCESIQKNVKASVQNMTGITVSKVNIVVVGVVLEAQNTVEEK